MRRTLVLIAVLLLLSAAGLAAAGLYVNSARAEVRFAETALAGDPAAAAGLTVTLNTHYDRHLFWTTCCRPAEGAAAETDFRFFQFARREIWQRDYGGVRLENDLMGGVDLLPDMAIGVARAFQALLAETPEGEMRTEEVRLSDYYDCYPLTIQAELPGDQFLASSWADYMLALREDPEVWTYTYGQRKLNDFFRIPVLPEETLQIAVERDGSTQGSTTGGSMNYFYSEARSDGVTFRYGSDGVSFRYGWDVTGNDAFDMQSVSAVAADACYFTFDAHTRQGALVDTGLIPGGYGIYRLPYALEGYLVDGQKCSGIDVDGLTMACPLSPDIRPVGLFLSEVEEKLLLLALEDGQCVLTVIDRETMTPEQRLVLGEGTVWRVFDYGGFLAVWMSENRLALVARDDAGAYRHRFTLTFSEGEDTPFALSNQAVMAWDGSRLAVADNLAYGSRAAGAQAYCSFSLAVYDETGLRYAGEYRSSLDAGGDTPDPSIRCQQTAISPLALDWDASRACGESPSSVDGGQLRVTPAQQNAA